MFPFARISIHSLYAEGDLLTFACEKFNIISIHSLYAEGDVDIRAGVEAGEGISIHSLYAEGDLSP